MTAPNSSQTVAARFWLGAVLPAVALGLLIALVVATGQGRREAPMILFFASLVAVPAVMLVNSWVLFVDWASRSRLLAAALVIPAVVGVGGVLVVHGTGRWHQLGMLVLLPFLKVPLTYPRVALALWLLAVVAAFLAAKRVVEGSVKQ